MPQPARIQILVLGPMRPAATQAADADPYEPRTRVLQTLVNAMIQDVYARLSAETAAYADGPDDNPNNVIIPGIVDKLERADLVICDLTGDTPNVMYELALVHALGLPSIVVTSDASRPFYVRGLNCITRLEIQDSYDPRRPGHTPLRQRIATFLAAAGGPERDEAIIAGLATNPVSEYFDGLPIVDISAPAGLAAGYWSNCVRRFVRKGGYFDPPARRVSFGGGRPDDAKTEQEMAIHELVVVWPVDGLRASYDDDLLAVKEKLRWLGFALAEATIFGANEGDMRGFGTKLLARLGTGGEISIITPAIAIDIPTTLYALQYAKRITQIGKVPVDSATKAKLRRRRYQDMIARFQVLMTSLIEGSDSHGHDHQVHFTSVDGLETSLQAIVPPA